MIPQPATIREVKCICRCIPDLGLVVHTVLGLRDYNDDTELTWGQFLILCFMDSWIIHSPGTQNPSEGLKITSMVSENLQSHVGSSFPEDLPFMRVGLVDKRYLSQTHVEAFTDIQTNERLEALPCHPVGTFSLDINAVLYMGLSLLESQRKADNAVSVAVQEVTEARRDFEERGQLRDNPINNIPG